MREIMKQDENVCQSLLAGKETFYVRVHIHTRQNTGKLHIFYTISTSYAFWGTLERVNFHFSLRTINDKISRTLANNS